MDAIHELIDLVKPMKLRHLKLIDDDSDQAGQLYQLIKDGQVQNDDEALDYFFKDNKHGKIYLKGLKDKIFNRQINTLLFLDQSKETEYQKAFYSAYRLFLAYKILSSAHKREASLKTALKGLKIAQKYHFTELIFFFSKELRMLYSIVFPNHKKFEEYNEMLKKAQEHFNLEIEVEEMLGCIAIFNTKKQLNRDTKLIIKEFAEKAKEIIPQTKAYWPLYVAGNILVIHYQIQKNHAKVTESCKYMLAKLESLPYQVPLPSIFGFNFKMIPEDILCKNYEDAKKTIDKCLKMVPEGSINWVKTKQLETLLYFHSKQYGKALTLTQLILKNYQKTIKDSESWEIMNAYARILNNEKLRLQKLFNQVPQYSRDKRGMNINILIIRILEYIRRGDFGEVIDNTSALNMYAYRYLRHDDTYRSNCFTRMLLALEKGHFNQVGARRHAKEHIEKLQQMPIDQSPQDYEVEIVPYEDLWEFLIKLLPKKA